MLAHWARGCFPSPLMQTERQEAVSSDANFLTGTKAAPFHFGEKESKDIIFRAKWLNGHQCPVAWTVMKQQITNRGNPSTRTHCWCIPAISGSWQCGLIVLIARENWLQQLSWNRKSGTKYSRQMKPSLTLTAWKEMWMGSKADHALSKKQIPQGWVYSSWFT